MNTNPIKGAYDYLPSDAELRESLKRKILDEYMNNGFSLITTPILENLKFLNKSEGGDNLKLMFKTVKRGRELNLDKENLTEEDIVSEGLRYDLTVPLLRMYANNKEVLPKPFKAIQVDYSFRAEKPQKGRDRQFIQCDIDILGDETLNAEIEILSTIMNVYKKVGLNKVTMKINSKKILHDLIVNSGFDENRESNICVSLDKLDKIDINGVEQELIDKGYESFSVKKLMSSIFDIRKNGIEVLHKYGVKQNNIDDMNFVIETLRSIMPENFSCVFDISIVRGQEYYTGFVYEAYADDFVRAIGGGGRYDNISAKLMGIDVPAVGFGLGFEPVFLILKETECINSDKKKIALIYDKENITDVLKKKQELMKDCKVSIYKKPKNLTNLLEKLKNANFDGFISFANALKGEKYKLFDK